MSPSVVADFVAEAHYDDDPPGEPPSKCRIVLGKEQLVVADAKRRRVVPLGAIQDIIVSRVPEELSEFFDQTVVLGYDDGSRHRSLQIQGKHERIEKFGLFLFRVILKGTGAEVKHPAKIGGRVTDEDLRRAAVYPKEDALELRGPEIDLTVDLEVITNVSFSRRRVDGESRQVISVSHMEDREAVTTEFYHESSRKLNILARYLRLRYFQLENMLAQMDVGDQEAEALVALYSGGSPEMLPGMLDLDEEDFVELFEGLVEKALVTGTEDPDLTSRGRLVVANRFEDVEL